MRRTHRRSARSRRWTSLVVCFVLIFSSLSLIISASSKSGFPQSGNGINSRNVKKVSPKPPQPGAPAAVLPNLDEMRQRPREKPEAPRQIESTMRSRRKPLESRHGRKVGDPLPPKKMAGAGAFGGGSERVSIDSAESRGKVGTATLDHARTARSLPTGAEHSLSSLLALINSNRRLLNHAALSFLRYPASHSDESKISILDWHSNKLGTSDLSPDATTFDLFLAPMPQSGSSKIVFASNREGSMQIYVMNGDGSGVARLTYSGANDDCPRWSPNGTKILFQSDRDNPSTGYMDIYVMNSDGSGVTRLTTDPNDDSTASWSPDGTKIVFQSIRNGVNYQVYSMNADGSNQVCLTNTSSSDGEPSWSPDGSKIAFASDRDHAGHYSVYVMSSNGSGQQRFTFSASTIDDTQPTWSPNGGKIAFVSTRDSTTETWQETDDDGNYITKSKVHINKEIYVMNSDGSGQTRLTNDLANDDAPSWSPDGTKIVFRSDRERDCCDPIAQVWSMNADGSGQTDISNDGAGNYTASWANGSGNMLPIANAGGTYSGTVAQNVPFHGTNSYDPDGTVVAYSWSFGDGGSASGVSPTHAYGAVGTYTVTLTVTDNLGAQGSASTTVDISSSSSDQFAQNFLQWGLGRAPYSNESGYWTDIMRSAYAQGQTSMLFAMTEFGMTVFESAEYAGRNRTNHEFVYDLYKTYLMRDPDQDGWDFWTSVCNSYGRESVRQGFEESTEFHNIVATLAASGNPSSNVSSLATARTDPFNQSGDQVQARDCEFSIPLLSLPGRAGLDLGLSLSYSSLVWAQSGPYVYFDSDNEGMSPGFSIGFPAIQWRSFDAQTARNVYLLTTGGHRIELRELGTSNVYESYDSSYLQLIDYGNSLTLKTTDGTQIAYGSFANGWQATSVKDRNGNVLTINNYWWGEIANITDTLGRVLTFNYDGNSNLNSITQSWSGQQQPHTWVTFGWGTTTIHPSFSSEVVGTFEGDNIPALTMVGFADGSYSKFGYNGYGQVSQMTHYASDSNPQTDNHPLNWTTYIYSPAGADCPRLSELRVSGENWTNVNDLGPYALTRFSDPGDGSRQMITPDNTVYKEFYGSGWQHGLVTSTQVITGSTVQKTTTTTYVQDDTSVNYQTNPRATVADISDGTNHSHTTIGYYTFTLPTGTSCSLPNDVYEYDADQTNVLRRTHTDYNLDSNYLNRRIIGLPETKLLYQGTSSLKAKTTYEYDWGGEYFVYPNPDGTQHDSNSYGPDFLVGRGNLSAVRRWDADFPDDQSKAILAVRIAHNSLGSVYFTRDALGHQTTFNSGDSFSDGNDRHTYAYPTTVTDADGFSTSTQYNYDFGAKTRVQGPPPQNQPNGIVQTFTYDNAARLQQATTANNGAYNYFSYGPTFTVTFSSVNSVSADPAYRFQVFDGLGRVIYAGGYHPGSAGGYLAVNTIYDEMGRVSRRSNPTEIASGAIPYGDDAAGWVYTKQTYDWKGRPLDTIHETDGTVKYASYQGCGCAGGEVVTLSDEGTVVNGQTVVRRQNVYSDALGRQWKTEVLNFDGTIYTTSVNVFNARDQVAIVNQYVGAAPSDASSTNEAASCPDGSCQKTTMSFDGHGRLQSKHVPEQNAGTATVYAYNTDDTIQSVTDARGASASYIYNNGRHLVNEIHYSAPSGITPTSNVTFGYDAAGNRTSMTDGLGTKSYSYNQLSQLMSETRTFADPSPPYLNGSYTLSYDYNFAGELKKITDATGMTINYGYDMVGRVTGVTGSDNLYAGVTNYASNFQYRAWGELKAMTDGTNHVSSLAYNSKLQPSSFDISGGVVHQNYDYYNDGRISFIHNTTDTNFDRSYVYDHVSRLSEAKTGGQSRGDSGANPYFETFGYNAFSNVTARGSDTWDTYSVSDSATYANNRRSDYGHDADGRVTGIDTRTYTYDAVGEQTGLSGQQWVFNHYVPYGESNGFDGDGRLVKRVASGLATYYLQSSVLHGVTIEQLDTSGQKTSGFVLTPSGRLLAQQGGNQVKWRHDVPANTGIYDTYVNGVVERTEFDPVGADIGLTAPPMPDTGGGDGDIGGNHAGDQLLAMFAEFMNPNAGCVVDGFKLPCGFAMDLVNMGAAEVCPNNDCSLRSVTINITWQNGDKKTINGFIGPLSGIPDGYNHTFTGYAAVEAATAWNENLSGGFENALMQSVVAGTLAERVQEFLADAGRRYAHGKPQKTHYWHPKPGSSGECHRFAAIVAELASKNPDPANFMQALKDEFLDRNAPEWGSGGFKPEFKDDTPPNNSPNQVYHYVGTFEAGYVGASTLGYTLGLEIAMEETTAHENEYDTYVSSRLGEAIRVVNEERTNWPTHVADRALNQQSVRHGALLGAGKIEPKSLSNMINAEICK